MVHFSICYLLAGFISSSGFEHSASAKRVLPVDIDGVSFHTLYYDTLYRQSDHRGLVLIYQNPIPLDVTALIRQHTNGIVTTRKQVIECPIAKVRKLGAQRLPSCFLSTEEVTYPSMLGSRKPQM